MTPLRLSDRRGATVGDVLVFMATLSVAAALLYPAWSVRDFRSRVEAVIADVDAVGAAARGVLESTGQWPTPGGEGEVPPELAGLGDVFARDGYAVRWTLWNVVDSVETPRQAGAASADDTPQLDAQPSMVPVVGTVGAVVVQSGEESLLAELVEHYVEHPSFVLDSTWLLVLPERAAAPGASTPGR